MPDPSSLNDFDHPQLLDRVVLALRAGLHLDLRAQFARQSFNRPRWPAGREPPRRPSWPRSAPRAADPPANRWSLMTSRYSASESKSLRLQITLARMNDRERFVVNHPLQIARAHVQHVADLGRQAAEIPDVHDRHGQTDMTHALAAHVFLGHFHAAAVADDAFIANAAVLSAVAFPILDRSEDLLAEQARLSRACSCDS